MPIWDPAKEIVRPGIISPHGASTPPTGWLECDGSAISRTTYSALFAAIGTTWGVGDGSTTFNIPDLRGYHLRGWDNGAGRDPGRVFAASQAASWVGVEGSDNQCKYSGNNDPNQGTFGDARTTTTIGDTFTRRAMRPLNQAVLICIKY